MTLHRQEFSTCISDGPRNVQHECRCYADVMVCFKVSSDEAVDRTLTPYTPPPHPIPSNIKRYGLWKVSWRYKHNSKAPIFLLCIDRRCGYEWDLFILLLDHVTPTSTPIAQGVSMAVEQCTCSHAGPLLLKWSLGGMCVPHTGSQLSILAPFFGYSLAPLKNISLTAPKEEEQRSNDFFA